MNAMLYWGYGVCKLTYFTQLYDCEQDVSEVSGEGEKKCYVNRKQLYDEHILFLNIM
jgi:hypothetical protein